LSPHHLQRSLLLFHFFFSHAAFSPSDTSSPPPCLSMGIFSLLRSGADPKVLLRAETTALALREGGDHKVGVELRWGGTPFSFFLSSRTSTPTTQTQAAAFPPRPHAPSPRSESRYLGREGRGGVSLCAPMLSLISPFLFFSLAEGGRCRTRCTVDFSGGGEDGRLLRTQVLGRGPRATTKVVACATAACCRPVGVSSFPRPSSSSSRRLLSKSWRPRRRSPRDGVGWGGVIVAALASIAGGRRRFLPGSRRLAFLELVRRFFGEKNFVGFSGLGVGPGMISLCPTRYLVRRTSPETLLDRVKIG